MDNMIYNEYSLYALMTGVFQEQNEQLDKKVTGVANKWYVSGRITY